MGRVKINDRDFKMLMDFCNFIEGEQKYMIMDKLNSVTKNWVNTELKRGDNQLVNVVIDYRRVSESRLESDIEYFLKNYDKKDESSSSGELIG